MAFFLGDIKRFLVDSEAGVGNYEGDSEKGRGKVDGAGVGAGAGAGLGAGLGGIAEKIEERSSTSASGDGHVEKKDEVRELSAQEVPRSGLGTEHTTHPQTQTQTHL